MAGAMISQNRINRVRNKRGSYIAEAAITLPVFFIAMIVMCSVILMYASIESAGFTMASELRRAAAEAIYTGSSGSVPYRVSSELEEYSYVVTGTEVKEYEYRTERWGYDNLIAMTVTIQMNCNNPLNIASESEYDVSLVTRAYVGRERDLCGMSEADMNADSDPVYIFPARGEKYHCKGCTFLNASTQSATLNSNIKKKYSSCPICHSSRASEGTLVFCFPDEGEAYHLPGCSVLKRNYIETDKKTAIKRGYSACSKCGG